MSKAFRVGAFTLVALMLFAAAVFWIGSKRFLLSSTYRVEADFDNVVGLIDGAEVRVGGLSQGTVKRIQLPAGPGGKVRVFMELKGTTRDVVKMDSVASISSEGLVGDKFVEVGFGSEEGEPVQAGAVLRTEKPIQIADLMKKADGILSSAGGAVDNIETTAENLKSISGKIDEGRGTAGALINDRSLYQKANASVSALAEDTEALKHNFLLRGFFNKRGYEDSADLSKHAIARLPQQAPVTTYSYDAKKIFDARDTAKLKNQKALEEAGHFLEQHSFGLAVVAAYQDLKGDSEKDLVLSEARAMVVRDYLVKNFRVMDKLIKVIGAGKSAEVVEGGEIKVLVYPAGTAIPAQPAAATVKP